jgi:hypothetical protein
MLGVVLLIAGGAWGLTVVIALAMCRAAKAGDLPAGMAGTPTWPPGPTRSGAAERILTR